MEISPEKIVLTVADPGAGKKTYVLAENNSLQDTTYLEELGEAPRAVGTLRIEFRGGAAKGLSADISLDWCLKKVLRHYAAQSVSVVFPNPAACEQDLGEVESPHLKSVRESSPQAIYIYYASGPVLRKLFEYLRIGERASLVFIECSWKDVSAKSCSALPEALPSQLSYLGFLTCREYSVLVQTLARSAKELSVSALSLIMSNGNQKTESYLTNVRALLFKLSGSLRTLHTNMWIYRKINTPGLANSATIHLERAVLDVSGRLNINQLEHSFSDRLATDMYHKLPGIEAQYRHKQQRDTIAIHCAGLASELENWPGGPNCLERILKRLVGLCREVGKHNLYELLGARPSLTAQRIEVWERSNMFGTGTAYREAQLAWLILYSSVEGAGKGVIYTPERIERIRGCNSSELFVSLNYANSQWKIQRI